MLRRLSWLALSLVTLLLPLSALAQPTDVTGHWEGAIQLPGQPLAFDVDLARQPDGAFRADISIPAQMARDLPLTKVVVEPPKVGFEIAGIPGTPTFAGTLAADGTKVTGTFSQGGASFPFEMARAATAAAKASQALEGFEAEIEGMLQDWRAPGLAIAIVRDGQVVFERGFGLRDVEAKLPVTPDTLFAIGSSSKAFTTFLLAQLVADGKLDWDQPLRRYLPSFRLHDPIATETITPRDLVTHSSGLPRHDLVWYNNQGATRAELVARLPHLEPTATLRQKFQYNNLMFLTAGYLAEQLTGKSWEEGVRERIFTPLGMARSNFDVAVSQQDADFAQPYRDHEKKIERIPFRPITNMGPAGSINSSVREMARWLEVHLGGGKVGERSLLPAPLVADLHTPRMVAGDLFPHPEISPVSYALGWFTFTYRGHQVVQHGGNIDGFSALVTLLPKDNLGVVALVNQNASALPSLASSRAVDRLLGLEKIDWNALALSQRNAANAASKEAEKAKGQLRKPGTKPAHGLDEYIGSYAHPGYGPLEVKAHGKGLAIVYNRLELPMEHWHYEVWSPTGETQDPTLAEMDLFVRFDTDMRGNVAGISTQLEPTVGEIRFERQPDAKLTDPAYLGRFVGEYTLATQTFTLTLNGSELALSQNNGPPSRLLPSTGGLMVIADAPIISVRFDLDAQGKPVSISFLQPDGVYTAKRKE
jgi:CubicO group peptidase (beta-lactamase class C family)